MLSRALGRRRQLESVPIMNVDEPRSGPISPPSLASESAPELVLHLLVPLRFLAAGGQLAALAVARFALSLPLPYLALVCVPLATGLSNVLLARSTVPRTRARAVATLILVLDTLLFTVLLLQSGGPDNPFSAIYAIHVAMAAMMGSARDTWLIAGLSALGYALAFFWHEPQHFWHGPLLPGIPLQLHAVGMWVAVAVVSAVITFFIVRITHTLRAREAELRDLGELAARNARLASLTTLAAGAAHELGSPLGTIAVIARDIARQAGGGGPFEVLGEDARLLRSEVERCRAILDRMSGHAESVGSESASPLSAREVASELGPSVLGADASRLELRVDAAPDAPLGTRADFAAVVLPLVRNALDASPSGGRVRVGVRRQANRIEVRVSDEGHGMSADVLERAGEPFFTTRPPGRGTGLGLFVVRLHAERLGGTLRLESAPSEGTTAIAEWPLDDGPHPDTAPTAARG
jgi:two-component system sensor histidine kinase RegB